MSIKINHATIHCDADNCATTLVAAIDSELPNVRIQATETGLRAGWQYRFYKHRCPQHPFLGPYDNNLNEQPPEPPQ